MFVFRESDTSQSISHITAFEKGPRQRKLRPEYWVFSQSQFHFVSSWWFQPIEKNNSHKWIIPPCGGENKQYLKPPPRYVWIPGSSQIHLFGFVFWLLGREPFQCTKWVVVNFPSMPWVRTLGEGKKNTLLHDWVKYVYLATFCLSFHTRLDI